MNGRVQLVVAAAGFGLAMHVAAHLAADPSREWLQWVVNWASMWLIVPLVAGRRSGRASSAVLLGSGVGAIEVAVYYGTVDLVAHKVAWLIIGALMGAVVGFFAQLTRGQQLGRFAAPLLMILEPIVLTAVFLLIGRHLGRNWFGSCSAEFTFGLVLAASMLKLHHGTKA